MTNEVSKGTERIYDLGKFAFTVSLGTAGLVASLVKDMKGARFTLALVAVSAALISAVCALVVAWPKTWQLDGNVDLAEKYRDSVQKSLYWLRAWAFVYGLAAAGVLVTILLR